MDRSLLSLIAIGILLILQLVSMAYWEPSWRHFTDGDIGEGFLRVIIALVGAIMVICAAVAAFLN